MIRHGDLSVFGSGMLTGKILALILAGGKGSRLGLLTESRAKPVMPFGGSYRLIDFALSNCRHSAISDVWVVEQYKLQSLNEHLSNGRPWDLDRTYGGLKVFPPYEDDDKDDGFAAGNADAIFRQRDFISSFNPEILVVLSADHIYQLDFREVIRVHLENQAEVTMVTRKVPESESASRFGVVKVNKKGRVVDFEYKPEKPQSDIITTEVFVYEAKKLLATLESISAKKGAESIKDFGHELIPQLVAGGRAFEYRHNSYWRDVGTIESYWQTHMDLLDEKQDFTLDDPEWAILTLAEQRASAYIYSSADVKNSLLAQGCRVKGKVKRSVLSTGATVEQGAEISDCIVLPNAVVEKGVRLHRAIVDAGARVTPQRLLKIKRQKGEGKILVIGKRKIQDSKQIADENN